MTDWLCTLAQARAEMKLTPDSTADDAWIIANIPLVSARINRLAQYRFIPWTEKYYYDAFGEGIDDVYRKLDLKIPLLYPIQVIDALSNSLTLGTDYVTIPQDNPAFQLQRINVVFGWSYGIGYGIAFWIAPIQFQRAIQVTGMWGYRTNYPSEGFTDTLQTLSADINDSQRTFNITNVNGVDSNAQAPCVSVGNYLYIGDPADVAAGELLGPVVATEGKSSVTVGQRGTNGFTASLHDADSIVYTWSVQPEIVRAATRWLGYWYVRRGAYEAVKSDLSTGKTLVYPADVPPDVQNAIDQLRDWRWIAV